MDHWIAPAVQYNVQALHQNGNLSRGLFSVSWDVVFYHSGRVSEQYLGNSVVILVKHSGYAVSVVPAKYIHTKVNPPELTMLDSENLREDI